MPAILEKTWESVLAEEKEQAYFQTILQNIDQKCRDGEIIYPPRDCLFHAFKATPLASIKAVIIGQDPYHGPNQAHGLCFSVQKGTPKPPSLRNIFLALEQDLQIQPPDHGCLDTWAQQGVLLLNTHLSVTKGQPQSHARLGWERFTDAVIKAVCNLTQPVVFLLWGAHAQKKAKLVHQPTHLILKAPHPSPLSAHRGFMRCKHFSKTNAWLKQHGLTGINWQIP
ncbi:MAG: uracil-DNA glycosylase [Pseudomonadota bacterium]|nr:uracil-DNA glycosylase [Pseudomonadota bacterium]MEC8977526.1 uracil-DNA glycosylase [Pseudomonadota bacterium]